jgi:N-acetylated-alpha-linked acidic dipeptidase
MYYAWVTRFVRLRLLHNLGAYHSAYHTFFHMTKFDDPGLVYAAVLSKMVGRLVLRATDSLRVPARYSDFATIVSR